MFISKYNTFIWRKIYIEKRINFVSNKDLVTLLVWR